jgi:hypothetical protein
MADEYCVAFYIEIVPTGRLDEDQLLAWYGKFGFEPIEGYTFNQEGPPMGRSPKPVTEPSPGFR